MIRQFLRFAQSGAVGTAAHYLVLAALVQGFSVNAVLASSTGAAVGAFVNYFLNYRWTFDSKLPHLLALPRYLAASAASLGLNFLLMKVLVGVVQFHYFPAQLISTALCLGFNYILGRCWAFRADAVPPTSAVMK